MKTTVPQFTSLDAFVGWAQTPQVREALEEKPELLLELTPHPNIKPWLREFREGMHELSGQVPPNDEESFRLLVKPSEKDKATIVDVLKSRSQKSSGDEVSETHMRERLETFGKYRNLRKVAEGGFGAVYKAYHPKLEVNVALKLLKLRTEGERKQFQREAKLAARLRHPNIISVHELDVHEDQPYYSMDFIEGKTLREMIKGKKFFHPQEAFEITAKIADALSYAHSSEVIHRDMKPENVFADDKGWIYVGDFGLARQVEHESGKAVVSQPLGTPLYMSPEQADNEELDGRTDVWALGVMLYEMLCGERPFEGKSANLYYEIANREPTLPRKLNPRLDRDAETIIMKCLEKEVERRYGSAAELKEDLESYLKGEPIKARPISGLERTWRRLRRNKLASAGIAAALLALIVIGVVLWRQGIERLEHEEEKGRLTKGIEAAEKVVEAARSKDPEEAVEILEFLLNGEYEGDPSVQYEFAYALLRSARVEEAIEAFELAAELAEEQRNDQIAISAHFQLGMAFQAQKKPSDAGYHLMIAREMAGDNSLPDLLMKAQLKLITGNPQEAIACWNELHDKYPEEGSILFMRAASQIQQRNNNLAEELFTSAIALFEAERNKAWLAWSYTGRGQIRVDMSRIEEGVKDFTRSLTFYDEKGNKRPRSHIYFARGQAFHKQKKLDAAMSDYKKALELNPGFVEFRYHVAVVLTAQRDFESAVAECNECLKQLSTLKKQDKSMSLLQKIAALQLAGKNEEAVDEISKATEMDADKLRENPDLLNIAKTQTQWIKSLEEERSLKLLPAIYAQRAVALQGIGKTGEAIKDLDKLIELVKPYGNNKYLKDAYILRAKGHKANGDTKRAVEDYTEAIKLDPDDYINLINRGIAYSALKDYDSAIDDYTKALTLNPNSITAYLNRGAAKCMKRDYAGSITDYSSALVLNPDYVTAIENRAMSYERLRQYDNAINDYSSMVELLKEKDDEKRLHTTYMRRAAARKSGDDIAGAIKDYSTAIEMYPEKAIPYSRRGAAYASKHDFDAAIADYTESIKLKPEQVMVYVNRGIALENKKEYDAAIADYSHVAERHPDLEIGFLRRGIVYENKGELEKAVADYTQVIKINNKSTAAYFRRAYTHESRGKPDSAIKDYTEVVKLNPKNYMAFDNRGWLRYQKKEIAEAFADFNMAIKLAPNFANVYNNRGWAHYEQGNIEKAMADYNKAIELDPRFVLAYNNRGWAYFNKGEFDKAVSDFERTLEIDRNFTKAWWNLASTYIKQEKREKAVAAYGELLKISPRSYNAYSKRAKLFHQLGKYEEAAADYENYLRFSSKNAAIWYDLACACARCGHKEKAITVLKKSLELDRKDKLKQLAKTDPDLESLREDPEFKRVVGK